MTIQHQQNRALFSALHDCDEMLQPHNEQFFVDPSFAAPNKDASWRSTALQKFRDSFSWKYDHRRYIRTRCADAAHTRDILAALCTCDPSHLFRASFGKHLAQSVNYVDPCLVNVKYTTLAQVVLLQGFLQKLEKLLHGISSECSKSGD